MLGNRFGRFDAAGTTYTVTDHRTPAPWVNIICNGRYGLVISQNGGGFSWFDNSQLNVLTRWDMDLSRDDRGKFIYVSDLDTGEVWSLTPSPCRPAFDAYQCEHTSGSTRFTTEFRGVRAVWTISVAPDDPVEVWTVELTNLTGSSRRLRIASFFEWCCGVAPDVKREFHKLFFTTRHDERRGAIIARKNMWDVPPRNEREHWNRPWPYVAAHAIGDAPFERTLTTADKESFFGRYGDPARPCAMSGPEIPAAVFGRFTDACASLGGDLTLAPKQTVRLNWLLTIAEDEQRLIELVDRYRAPEQAWRTAAQSTQSWKQRLAPTTVRTSQPDFDLLNNHWLRYQAISGRLWGRAGYYQQSGAFGFRDQLQDSQVWLTLDPAQCRKQILLHAAHQFKDGSVYHWWHPLTETGLRTACSDDYLWLPFVVANYIKETGDFDILDERVAFVDDQKPATILDHCQRSFARSFTRHSARGLPFIGSCDWNDGLSAVGVGEKGESVWLAFFLSRILGEFAQVLDRAGRAADAAAFRERRRHLCEAIEQHAWGGDWYLGASLDSGEWIGSPKNSAGRIFLNCQTWATLSESADPGRAATAWESAKRLLLADMGPLLLAPAYTEPDADIGYITRYSPGSRENGGVYMHAAVWALACAAKRRDARAVEQIWRSISPPLRSGADAERYAAEPYVTPGNVDGPLSDRPGRAGWTWYTGSAAWLNKVSLDWIMGVRADWDGLVIDPCVWPELGECEVVRAWRGRQVRVRFDAREYRPDATPVLTLYSTPLSHNRLEYDSLPPGDPVDIVVVWTTPDVIVRTVQPTFAEKIP